MALDLKSVVRNQVASRTSRGLKAGLTKVTGNILGSALGSASSSAAASLSNFNLHLSSGNSLNSVTKR